MNIFRTFFLNCLPASPLSRQSTQPASPVPATPPKVLSIDYFSLRRRRSNHMPTMSPVLPRLPSSPTTPAQAPSLSSSSSSRGSWSSLFNAGTVRHLMTGGQEFFRDGSLDSSVLASGTIPVPGGGRHHGPESPLKKRASRDQATPLVTPVAKSWSEPPVQMLSSSSKITVTFSSAGHVSRKPTFSQVATPQIPFPGKMLLVADEPHDAEQESGYGLFFVNGRLSI